MPAIFAPVLALLMLLVPSGGWLGVYLSADHDAATVTEVVPDSPAAKAGLRAGDVFVSVGNTKTPTREKLMAAIGDASPGDRVKIRVRRGSKLATMVVKLGKRPSDNSVAETARPKPAAQDKRPAAPKSESRAVPIVSETKPTAGGVYIGIGVMESDDGVMIDRVLANSPAKAAGVKAGERLTSIGDQRIGSLSDLDKALAKLRAGKPIAFGLRSEDSRRSIMVTPAKKPAKPSKAKPSKAKSSTTKSSSKSSSKGSKGIDAELKAMRRELAELKKELLEMRKQLRRQRR